MEIFLFALLLFTLFYNFSQYNLIYYVRIILIERKTILLSIKLLEKLVDNVLFKIYFPFILFKNELAHFRLIKTYYISKTYL